MSSKDVREDVAKSKKQKQRRARQEESKRKKIEVKMIHTWLLSAQELD